MRQLFQNLIENAIKVRKTDVDPVVTITAEFTNGEKPSAAGTGSRHQDRRQRHRV